MLTRPRGIAEAYWVGGGALLLIALRLVPLKLAANSVAKGSDVYLFLIGMMLLSELAREHGVFEWLSSAAVRRAQGSCTRLFTLVYSIGTLVTIFMSNDATAVVLTPAILGAVRKSKIEPLPYLLACAFVANAASFVLPISNPANLVVYRTGMPPLGQWVVAFGLPSLLSIATTFLLMRLVFRKELRASLALDVSPVKLPTEGVLVLAGLAAMVVVLLTASSLRKDLGLPTCLASLAITALLAVVSRKSPLPLLREISWKTLALVAGLFILVGAVEANGGIHFTQACLLSVQRLQPALSAIVTGFSVGIGNNLVNNLPLGLIAGATLAGSHTTDLLAHAILIGIDLGPNLSITGSLATILWLLALRKHQIQVGFWQFLRVGIITMPIALAFSLCGSILMHALVKTS